MKRKKAIEALSSKYSADSLWVYFSVNYKGREIAFVRNTKRYSFELWHEKYFSKLPFSNKLYMIMSELAMTPLDKRKEDKKYYVKVFNHKFGYLNISNFSGEIYADDKSETYSIKTKFTSKAIKQLKRREDVALDWNKVKLEEVD